MLSENGKKKKRQLHYHIYAITAIMYKSSTYGEKLKGNMQKQKELVCKENGISFKCLNNAIIASYMHF